MKLTVQRKLIAVALLPVLGLAACGWLGLQAFRAAGVGGPAVRRLLATYDVAADVTPAAADLASSFATVQALAAGGDADRDAESLRALRASHEAFEHALEAWAKGVPAGVLHDALIQRVGRTGRDYVAQCEDEFVPAFRRDDRARAAAIASGPLRRAFDAHRRALEDLAPLVAAQRRADAAAAAEAAETRVRLLIVLWALVGAGSLAFGLWVANHTVSAVVELRRVARAMAAGDLGIECAVHQRDEVGQLADSIQLLRGSLQAVIAPLNKKAVTLAHASEELSNVSYEMSSTAEETSSQASTVSTSSHQVSRSVETVAAAVEEMSASVLEISKNTGEAARIASDAAAEAQATNAKVSKLGESSSEIGNVIQVISAIAQQTNLLALNAAIEAARAGEAGKGFAVVANEVKELAKGTAAATEDISHKIVTIQSDTAAAIAAIAAISATIQQIKDISNSIASAVDEQLATTSEIGRNLGEAARGASEISDGVLNVAQAAKDTAAGSARTQAAAGELARMAAELRRMTERFRLGAAVAEVRRLPVEDRAGGEETLASAA